MSLCMYIALDVDVGCDVLAIQVIGTSPLIDSQSGTDQSRSGWKTETEREPP